MDIRCTLKIGRVSSEPTCFGSSWKVPELPEILIEKPAAMRGTLTEGSSLSRGGSGNVIPQSNAVH